MKKFNFTLFVMLLIQLQGYSQGVGINNDNTDPDPSAMLHVKSTTQGLLVPRMTSAQKIAIATPATGLLVFQTNGTAGFYYYDGSTWVFISSMDTNIYTTNGVLNSARTVTQAGFPLSFTSTATNGFSVDGSTFSIDAANNRVGLGTAAPQEDLHIYRPDTDIARVYATGTNQGSGMFYAGQSMTYGGGFVYDGDGAPALVGGVDRVTFFRRDNGADVDVISYRYNSNVVRITDLAGTGNRMVVANALGDLTTQALPAGDNLGNHIATANLNMSNREVDNVNYLDFRAGNGYGLRFWSSNTYAINMGNAAEYRYGPVTDYSIKSHMNNDPARGWTWGVDGATPVAALNTQGAMQIQGNLKISNNNVTGGGLILSDDGGIYDRNDGYASLAFSNGVDFEDAQDVSDHMQVRFNDSYPEFWGYRNNGATLIEFRTGMYNNGGTFYSQNQMFARGGLANDQGNLTLNDVVYVTGNVGLRTAAPTSDLHLKMSASNFPNPTTGGITMENAANTNEWQFWNSNPYLSFAYNNVRVAYINSASGAWTVTSDARFKKDVEKLPTVLDKVMQLSPVKYRYNHNEADATKTIGFIAQEVKEVFPELVYSEDGSQYALSPADFGILSIKAIQEQQKTIEALKAEVEELKALIKGGK